VKQKVRTQTQATFGYGGIVSGHREKSEDAECPDGGTPGARLALSAEPEAGIAKQSAEESNLTLC